MPVIWIDIDNIPHVLIFRHIIQELSAEFQILLTVRDHAFACEMLDEMGLAYRRVGRHYGKGLVNKVLGTLWRAWQLIRLIKREAKPVLAVSHGSRSSVIAAYFMRIPVLTLFDYEHVAGQVFEFFSTKILVPEKVKRLPHQAQHAKYFGYPGFKEELYLCRFKPDADFPKKMGWDAKKIITVIRPPAVLAHYHDAAAEVIFQEIFKTIERNDHIHAVIAPRTKADLARYENLERFQILHKPVNGLDLIYWADLVIGGGGTMNREAALLGVPVYSIFKGKRGVLDQALVHEKKLVFIDNAQEIAIIDWKKKIRSGNLASSERTCAFVVNFIKSMITN